MVASDAVARTVRIATWHVPLSRDGPGLLLRDILSGTDPQITAFQSALGSLSPDIILLTNIDFDASLSALSALAPDYPVRFALRPNTGMSTGLDLDGNGSKGEPRDAQGYGRFAGDGGMAILSRVQIQRESVRDLSGLIWADLPFATPPPMTAEVAAIQRLSTTGHWIVPFENGLTLLAFAASPPIFDGPEDRNGRRARDELRLWTSVLDGDFGPLEGYPVAIGLSNLDPKAGEGDRQAMATFLADPRLQDPLPDQPTATTSSGPLRLSYILPDRRLSVTAAGKEDGIAPDGANQRLLWIDLTIPTPESP